MPRDPFEKTGEPIISLLRCQSIFMALALTRRLLESNGWYDEELRCLFMTWTMPIRAWGILILAYALRNLFAAMKEETTEEE